MEKFGFMIALLVPFWIYAYFNSSSSTENFPDSPSSEEVMVLDTENRFINLQNISYLKWGYDSQFLIGFHEDNVYTIDPSNGKIRKRYGGYCQRSIDGRYALFQMENTKQVVDLSSFHILTSFPSSSDEECHFAVDSHGKQVAVLDTQNNVVKVWLVSQKTWIHNFSVDEEFSNIFFSHDDTSLVLGYFDKIYFFGLDGTLQHEVNLRIDEKIRYRYFSLYPIKYTKQYVLIAKDVMWSRAFCIFSDNMSLLRKVKISSCITLSDNGKFLICREYRGEHKKDALFVWSTTEGLIGQIFVERNRYKRFDISNDGERIVGLDNTGGRATIWEID